MPTVVITGAAGFVGKNLIQHLAVRSDLEVLSFDVDSAPQELEAALARADFLVHLAGVNRPQDEAEFTTGNLDFTQTVLELLTRHGRKIPVLLTSSTQAELDNAYGRSKLAAEKVLQGWAEQTGGTALIYRLPGLFGKWCRPNYNSVVATFCHNIAHDEPIQVNDPGRVLQLAYIDEVCAEFLRALDGKANMGADGFCRVPRSFEITLNELAEQIQAFRNSRNDLILPDFSDDLTRFLYATYISYLPEDSIAYPLTMKRDERGWLAELLKSRQFGQIFVSRTKPGITRGHHWHHTKVEKFIVIEGEAVIRFRKVDSAEIIEVPVSGTELKVVDIPTGYTHSITNTGATDLITLFWADELFNPENTDTVGLEV